MSFRKRLTSGEFVVLAEMNTPKGVDISELVNNARRIKGRVDAVIVPDMENGIMRMSALAGGVLMHQQGVESIINVYCRDVTGWRFKAISLAPMYLAFRISLLFTVKKWSKVIIETQNR